ncbi:hypothetical protein ANCDUO_02648, partial [Ancylostoma duodenale]
VTWSTYRKPGEHSVTVSAGSTPTTKLPNTRRVKSRSSLKDEDVTIVSKQDLVVKPSPSSERRPRPLRRLCFVWSAQNASTRSSCPSSGASTSSWEDRRRHVARSSNS